ncbi:MAG TPA: GntR family transcriptional regulator [Streptosporangiaceae bacterium]|nr:GntR family transcriptional regulator [Streptosporangiaceae bacterium]
MTRRLNFKSHIPLYIQLTEILKERIEVGEWQPGHRFASEGEIGAEFGVSRAVVRPALAILANDGQLVKVKGRGVFVAPKKVVYSIDGLVRNLLVADTEHIRNRIIDSTEDEVDERLAKVLSIPPDRAVVAHIMSLVEVDGHPIGIRDSYISPLISDAVVRAISSQTKRTVPLVFADVVNLERSEIDVEVSSASPFEAERLDISAGSPTILASYREFARIDTTGTASIEFARMVYRADITSLRFATNAHTPAPSDV